MKWCERCGGPRGRPLRELTLHGCRLCWLALWTSQEVRWDAEEDAGYSAEGESLSAVEAWMARDALANGTLTVERCNSTDDTAADSTWLPPGQRLHGLFSHRLWLDELRAKEAA
jgi:hypothetical protein